MDMLYAPWREEYTNKVQGDGTPEQCVFCTQLAQNNDDEYLILARYKNSCCIMNKYPYNSGHLLLIPFEHKADLEELTEETRQELMYLINQGIIILKREVKAQGVNVGINLGKAAGAGIPAHLHIHLLPRWLGDTNFLPTLTNTKQVSTDIVTLFKKLKPHFQQLQP